MIMAVWIILVLFIGYIAKFVYRYFRLNKLADIQANRFLYSVYSRRHLYNLTPTEFEKWCGYLLRRLGYDDVIVMPEGPDGGKDIVCYKDGEKIYVECKRYLFDELADLQNEDSQNSQNQESEDKKYKANLVGREILQKLVGAMVGDGVHKGMLITTGDFHSNAYEYVASLPKEYQVELIDGRTLCDMYEKVIENTFDVQIQIPNIDKIKF